MVHFSLFKNDPLYRILAHLRLVNTRGMLKNFPTILLFISITWIPTALLANSQGLAINPIPENSFLYDFAAYAQFFFAIPFFIWAESMVDTEVRSGLFHFVESGLIQSENDLRDLNQLLDKASRLQSATLLGFSIYILAHILTWIWLSPELTNGLSNWHTYTQGGREYLTLAGWWNGIISVPIMVYWQLRWIWKVGIWYWILWNISKMKLQLHACHPDQFGGLGFLSRLQSKFAILILGVGIMFAATIGYKIIIEKAPLDTISVAGVVILYSLVAPLIFLIPLFFFQRQLSQTKNNDLLSYSALATYHTAKIERMLKKSTEMDSPVTINDVNGLILELSNLRTFFENANRMYTLPFDFQYTRRLFASALGPMLPIIIQSPIIKAVVNAILGTDY